MYESPLCITGDNNCCFRQIGLLVCMTFVLPTTANLLPFKCITCTTAVEVPTVVFALFFNFHTAHSLFTFTIPILGMNTTSCTFRQADVLPRCTSVACIRWNGHVIFTIRTDVRGAISTRRAARIWIQRAEGGAGSTYRTLERGRCQFIRSPFDDHHHYQSRVLYTNNIVFCIFVFNNIEY